MSAKEQIPEEDRLPTGQKILISIGGFTQYLVSTLIFNKLWMPILNIGFGLNPVKLGMVAMVLKWVDAIVDPVIGNISDNTRSKWGRRRPYIVIGAILTSIITPLIWHLNTGWGETFVYIYVGVMAVLIYTCMSIWQTPYHSFLMEMTPNYDERTRLFAWTAFFTKLIALSGGWILAIVSLPYFAKPDSPTYQLNPDTGVASDMVVGTQFVSIIISIVILISGTLPALFIKERYYDKSTSKQKKESLWLSIKETMRNRAFRALTFIVCLKQMGLGATVVLGQYVNIYYINKGQLNNAFVLEGWITTASMAAAILSIPFWTWFCEKFDKTVALTLIIIAGFIGHGLNFFCLDPNMPYLQLIPAVFNNGIIGSIWLIVPSMKADVADYDELETGKRREGSINSAFSVILHASMAVAMGIAGVLLGITGFDVSLGAEQKEGVLNLMVTLYIIAPFLFWGISLFLLKKYPLNRHRMQEIRAQLEERRGKL